MRIEYVDWGLANYFEDHIEINKDLRRHRKLLDYVLAHELGHKKGFDLWHEFDFKLQLPRLIMFVISHPKTWIDFLPIQYRKKRWVYDTNLFMLYGMALLLLFIAYILF